MAIASRIVASISGVRQREDGWFNLTDLAKKTDRRISRYTANASTAIFLEKLSAELGIPASLLLDVSRGGRPGSKAEYQGTWAHPRVAMHFAYWADESLQVDFTAWIVDRLLLELHCDDTISGTIPDPVDQECDDGDRPATSIPTAAECMALSDCG